jgi:hypothetical protein
MRIRLGIPAYGGIQPLTARALILTYHALHLCGHKIEVDMVSGGSVLPKVRNEIVQRFWDAGEDVLVFLDSDMAWNPVDVVRLIGVDKPLVCSNYRIKSDEDKWVCYLTPSADGRPVVENDLIRIEDGGTGFMAIKRKCIAAMREEYPDLRYTDKDGGEMYALFDFILQDGKYWGEDYAFCARWRNIGGLVWMMPDATIDHIGTKAFTGNYHEYLQRLPGGAKEGQC